MSRLMTLVILVSVSSAALPSCAPETRPTPLVPFSEMPADPGAQLEGEEITDQQLLQDSRAPGFTFYKGDPARLPFTPGGGGHGGFIRVRFNSVAQGALAADGRLPEGASFPEGSVVVKEIYDDASGPLTALAIIQKSPSAPNAAAGWVWGEYSASGKPFTGTSAADRGVSCVSCHSATAQRSRVPGDRGNRDLIRTFGIR